MYVTSYFGANWSQSQSFYTDVDRFLDFLFDEEFPKANERAKSYGHTSGTYYVRIYKNENRGEIHFEYWKYDEQWREEIPSDIGKDYDIDFESWDEKKEFLDKILEKLKEHSDKFEYHYEEDDERIKITVWLR